MDVVKSFRAEPGRPKRRRVNEYDVAAQLLLQEMERDWKDFYARYGHIQGVIDMVRAAVA